MNRSLDSKRVVKKIISLKIDAINFKDAITKIIGLAKSKKSSYVCFANVHMTIEAYHDKLFAEQVNNATMVLADGIPIVTSFRLIHKQRQERIAGMDAMPALIHAAEQHQLSIFFFGTTPELLEKIRIRVEKEFPHVRIAGLFSPPFNTILDDASFIETINQANPDLVFIALGCPKQEKWMATHSSKINAVLLGVGGAFPVYAGVQKRAPAIMQNLGLEWLYRMLQEPNRLFTRYLKTNSLFIYLLAKGLLSDRHSRMR